MRITPVRLGHWAALGVLAGNVGRLPGPSVGTAGTALTLLDLTLVPLWLYLFVQWRRGALRWALDAVSRGLLLFIGVAVASLLLAIVRWQLDAAATLTALAFLVRWVAYAGWFVLVVALPDGAATAAQSWRGLSIALGIVALFGIVQSIWLPGFAQRVHSAEVMLWDRQGHRLVSTILDPNYAASLLLIAFGMAFARRAMGARLWSGALPVLAVALALTLSRSGLVGLVVVVGTCLLVSGVSRQGLGRAVGIAVLLVPLVPPFLRFAQGFNKLSIDVSGMQRLVAWLQGWALFADAPLLGVGFNALGPARRAYGFSIVGSASSMDGGLLFIGVMTGVLGLAAFTWMWREFLRAARDVWRDDRRSIDERATAVGAAAVSLGLLAQSFFVNAILLPFVMMPLWMLWGWVVALRRTLPKVAALMALVVVMGCDPCAGLLTCEVPPARVAAGTILDRDTRRPRAGVRVTVGALTAVTNAEGRWSVPFAFGPDSILDIEVRVNDSTAYVVPQVYIRPRTRVGDVDDLGPWFDRPILQYITRVLYRGVPLENARLEFRPAAGSRDSLLATTTSSAGYVDLFGTADRLGEVIGTLRIVHPLIGDRSFEDISVPSDYRLRMPTVVGVLQVDRPMVYVGEVVDRSAGYRKIGGALVTFVRRSGARVMPESLSVRSDPDGRFTLRVEALSIGTVRGDITVISPDGRHQSVRRDMPLTVRDTVTARYLGFFPYGQLWAWAIELWNNDRLQPAPNIRYRFERTAGLSIVPSTFDGITDAGGRIWLSAPVSDSGTVRGRLTVYPDGQPSQQLPHEFVFDTFQGDQPAFAGTFVYGPALRLYGALVAPDGAPLSGATVTWERTGGIGASPAVLTSLTGSDGRFDLRQSPVAFGEVIGRVTVRPPLPWPVGTALVFDGVRLEAHDSAEPRVGLTLRLPAP